MALSRDETRTLVQSAVCGDEAAADRLMIQLYDELREMAAARLRREHTLQPTALVNEAYLKILGNDPNVQGATHFRRIAAVAMRQVLIDHARGKGADKRGGGWKRVCVLDSIGAMLNTEIDVLSLEAALDELSVRDPRAHQIVLLRFFGGMTGEQVAELLDVSRTTVANDWQHARAWLRERLERGT